MQMKERVKDELIRIVDLFSSQSLPEVCAKAFINAIGKPSSKWSFSNQIIMILHGTEDARGFHQWKEVKRSVKGGARAFHILGPVIIKKTVIDKETGEEKEEKRLIGFKSIPVFRYEDTIGKPLEEYKPKELPPLMEVAENGT